jgi:hypothetical protein
MVVTLGILRCAQNDGKDLSQQDDGSLVLGGFWVGDEVTRVGIQVGKDRTAVDGRDSRDSSPFEFAQGQNDGKDLQRKNNAETNARATTKTRQWLACCLGREADFSAALFTKA